jgi:RNA polymerase sigma-70 factor (ECF subfamily)
MVLAAGRSSSRDAEQALAKLCQTYWYPLYAYVRRRVPDVHEAQDLTQAFFTTLMEKNYVAPATPERGRFRAYLLTCFKHFLANEWQKAKAQKRGGGRVPLSLDFERGDSRLRLEPHTQLSADELYMRQWAVAMLERVMDRLREEQSKAGAGQRFELLKSYLVGSYEGQTYAQAAARLGITETAAKTAASRMRKRYRELLRNEIAQTVACPDEIDQEIRDLFTMLGG